MSWLRIFTQRAVWPTRLRCRFESVSWRMHPTKLLSSSRSVAYAITHPVHYSADQYHACRLRCRIKIHSPERQCVHAFSSSRKPLLFTDDLLQNHIKQIVAEWNEIQKQLTCNLSDDGQLSAQSSSKRLHFLQPLVSNIQQHEQLSVDISELEDMISVSADKDVEVCETAEAEIADLKMQMAALEDDIVDLLLPSLVGDDSDIILEVHAGVGGQEAMLFTKEVFHMYMNYASYKGWSANIVDYEETDVGGIRHGVAAISGQNVFMQMKFEGGVHRVQRVPKTEKSGRMHTSTVTVAILPQPSEIDVVLHPKELRIETCRASGKGGQHVNKTESAVRIVHLPTGTAAECQVERSQIRNREIAMTVLRSRIYQKELEKSQQQQSSTRKLQVGSAGRSEKIRTYNMRDDRVTDHRMNENVYGVSRFLDGAKELDALIDMVQMEARHERLAEQLQEHVKTSTVADSDSG